MLRTVEVYEPSPTIEEVKRENDSLKRLFSQMTDASLDNYIRDMQLNGEYNAPGTIFAMEEVAKRNL